MDSKELKAWQSYQKSVARRSNRARNMQGKCLVCLREEYIENASKVDTMYSHLTENAKMGKKSYWLNLANRKLKDIQCTPNIDTFWACGLEHFKIAKEIAERYLTEFKNVEVNREKERTEWRLRKLNLVELAFFKERVFGKADCSAEDLLIKYLEHIDFNLMNMDEKHNQKLSELSAE